MKTISFISCLFYAVSLTDGGIISVEGFEGRSVSFQCLHNFAWSNNKYFCKDPCTSTGDILVTVEPGRRAESGRITLVDSGDGSFTVTFSHLQLLDSKKYWCGVERPFFDTYTKVQLTVKKVVETETAVILNDFSTWTYQNIHTTHLVIEGGTLKPTHLSKGTIIYATVGGASLIAVLLLAVWFGKSKQTSKEELQVYCNISHLRKDKKREVSCGFNDADKKTKCSKKSSCVFTLQKRPEPPTSEPTTNKCSVTIDTDDNIYFTKLPAHSENSATEDQNDYANNSAIYIIPLPDIMYDTTDDGTCREHMPNP
ncbi:heat shock protein [Sarotherodon galilaeus]